MTSNNKSYPIIRILFDGYSNVDDDTGDMLANCTCTLIQGLKYNYIVDTMTCWDGDKIVEALKPLTPNDINFVICTHAHTDHTGCNYLFQNAKHIVGDSSFNFKDKYYSSFFNEKNEFELEPEIKLYKTPGHTSNDISVIVNTGETKGIIAITGDIFEKEEDLNDSKIWIEIAGSEDPVKQLASREKILKIADYIIPGHGSMFKNNMHSQYHDRLLLLKDLFN